MRLRNWDESLDYLASKTLYGKFPKGKLFIVDSCGDDAMEHEIDDNCCTAGHFPPEIVESKWANFPQISSDDQLGIHLVRMLNLHIDKLNDAEKKQIVDILFDAATKNEKDVFQILETKRVGLDILEPGWYFWDEVGQAVGPYDTKLLAIFYFHNYVKELNGDK